MSEFTSHRLPSIRYFTVPPEAIRNLVTPVATPWSVRQGFFNLGGHTTVCHTGFFFNTSGHTTVCETFFFWYFKLGTSMTIPWSHRPGQWYGHWRPTSKKWQKNPVCETVVWPLTLKNLVRKTEVWSLADRVKNLNAVVHHPSKLSLIDRRRMPALKLLDSGLPHTIVRNGRGQI